MMESDIKEDFIYYIWKTKSFQWKNLKTVSGKSVKILDFGHQNYDAGPDFSHCTVDINGIRWVGNVEMHVFSSDWDKHSHDTDPAYDNVILHVVYEHDQDIIDTNSRIVETIELKNLIFSGLRDRYLNMMHSGLWIPCADQIHKVTDFTIKIWLDKLIVERLERKVHDIFKVLEECNTDWEETFYRILAKYMGGKVNRVPFELLARSLPSSVLKKNADNQTTLDALLFGQSGMLMASHEEDYFQRLKREFSFYKKKYELTPINPTAWKFFRMRPVNFPTLRIAQLSSLIHRHKQLFSALIHTSNYPSFFEVSLDPYWDTHYRFGKSSSLKPKVIGDSFRDVVLINVLAPILFAYGQYTANQDFKDRALSILQDLKPENNAIIKNWKSLDVTPENASDSQALLTLKTAYCDQSRCLSCAIGHRILR